MNPIERLARELVANWEGWLNDASVQAQVEQDADAGDQTLLHHVEEFLRQAVCRVAGHAGVVWYDADGLEPDMHCRRCGEDLA